MHYKGAFFMLSLISTITGMVGALLLANGFLLIGYCLFLVGSITATILIYPSNKMLGYQFIFFTLCNMLGIYNNL